MTRFSLISVVLAALFTGCGGTPAEQPAVEAAPDAKSPAPDAPAEANVDLATPPASIAPAELAVNDINPTNNITPTVDVVVPADAPAGIPNSVDAIEGLLKARHTDDLPTRSTLNAHPQALEALIYITANADRMVTRTRALTLLGLYPNEQSAKVLRDTASNTALHPSLQAAALRGLAGHDLSQDSAGKAIATAALQHTDIRVQEAAKSALQ